jgi:hypothetical protein
MSVHKEISEHVNKANLRITEFLALDQKREFYIEEAVNLCKQGKQFSTEKINEVTNKINELSRQGIVPPRKKVTIEMVKEYTGKIQS